MVPPAVPSRRRPGPALTGAVDALLAAAGDGSRPVHVLDLGGGTGGQAVRLAVAGHRVTVVDPSPDALAALGRRAAEAGTSVEGVQGDAEGLADVVGDASIDLVLCHGVLDVVDDPAVALASVGRVLRPSGHLSLVVAQRQGAVLARVSHGQLRQAERIALDPDGRWGEDDPLRRRFDARDVRELLTEAGFVLLATEGLRVFADLVPRTLPADEDHAELLGRLEAYAAASGAYVDIAAALHLHARPAGARPT